MGVAQQTTSIFWYEPDTTTVDPYVLWVTDVANDPNPSSTNSMSWGSNEILVSPTTISSFNTEALKLSAMGVTITVSSGDDGAAGRGRKSDDSSSEVCFCPSTPVYGIYQSNGYNPSFPATSPYVTGKTNNDFRIILINLIIIY